MTQIIAGLNFKYIKHIQYNNEEGRIPEIGPDPIIKVESSPLENTYTVTIGSYLPKTLTTIENITPSSIEIVEDLVYIQYNGLTNVQTVIPTTNPNNAIICRDFNLIYNSVEPNPTIFNFYLIIFQYTFVQTDALRAEAIIVKDENLDPETSRGTVSTPRNPSV